MHYSEVSCSYVLVGGNLKSWKNEEQNVVARSCTKAKYRTITFVENKENRD